MDIGLGYWWVTKKAWKLHITTWSLHKGPVMMAHSRLAPSQWETSLQSNAVSHWLGANLESALNEEMTHMGVHHHVLLAEINTNWIKPCFTNGLWGHNPRLVIQGWVLLLCEKEWFDQAMILHMPWWKRCCGLYGTSILFHISCTNLFF